MDKPRHHFKTQAWIFSLALLAFWPRPAQALQLNVGVTVGLHMAGSTTSVESAGTSLFGSLYAQAGLGKGFLVGLAYGLGSSMTKPGGSSGAVYSDWKINGFEIQVGYQHQLKEVTPYAGIGLGRFRFEPKSSSPAASSDTRFSLSLIAGFRAAISHAFFGVCELRYAFLSFKPQGNTFSLSGIRLSAGVGFSFDI